MKKMDLVNFEKLKFGDFKIGVKIYTKSMQKIKDSGILDFASEIEKTGGETPAGTNQIEMLSAVLKNVEIIQTEIAPEIIAYCMRDNPNATLTLEKYESNLKEIDKMDVDTVNELAEKCVSEFINFFQKKLTQQNIQMFSNKE